jgi:hypothetical protein
MAYKTKLTRANEKVVADLKASEAVTSEVQRKTEQSPARDKFLDLTEREREAVIEYLNIVTKKQSVRFTLSNDPARLALDHSSARIVQPVLMNAFGSTDKAFIDGIVAQLANAVSDGDEADLHALNFAVSMINGIEPRNQLESVLAAQMAAVHMAFMTYFRHLTVRPRIYDQDIAERALNRLGRTFVSQVEALQRYRTGGEKVVSQQVSVAAGGQAIVGNVMQGPSEMAPERKAGASPRAALAGTNVVRMPEKAKQVSKGTFRRRPTK